MKSNSTIKKGLNSAGQLTRDALEHVGSLLDSMNAKTMKTSKYQAVDLADINKNPSKEDLFRQSTVKASQELIGQRFSRYGKYAKKVVPNSMVQKAMDSAFMQIAKLASAWSQMDLPDSHRFAGISQLDEQQRKALATDIANQNRALAALGGVSGLAGLAGMLADSLWLLLVSLRTIYQIAAVYDQPLTGNQGIKMAYDILSHADLSKMQEKQTLLAGLGVAKGLLDNADHEGLRREFTNMGTANSNISYYMQQVDNVVEHFDLDNINLSWLTKILPVSSMIIGIYYNNDLIDEVIGVAQATFGPEPKFAKKLLTNHSPQKNSTQTSEHTKGSEVVNNTNTANTHSHTDIEESDDSDKKEA
ncbi:EcsC family protein [Psychrobacter sp. I-STPA10]|uniref:EcsC family protein n=1 Tax=Psychrobacter sp. I-STPA10 TaxID=2585769 RepID=UPI001E5D5D31|nr:EcsC family protein [Psychrobacter sp. I-STPA10]